MERLQKRLARAGIASRRKAEDLIASGRVRVNGHTATIGQQVELTDRVEVDGTRIDTNPEIHTTFAFNKPRGVITSAQDDLGRGDILQHLPAIPGLHPVGRLDKDSEGLLIFTTDGALTQHLTHPRHHHEKTYRVWTHPAPEERDLETLRHGLQLEDGPAHAKRAKLVTQGAYVTLTEGRKRQLRRMFEALGMRVTRLMRVSVGTLELGDLRPGEWREVNAFELKELQRATRRAPTRKRKT